MKAFKEWLNTNDGRTFLYILLEVNQESRALEARCLWHEKISKWIMAILILLAISLVISLAIF